MHLIEEGACPMNQYSKAKLIRVYRKQYRKATKKEEGRIVSQIEEATGYTRKPILFLP